MKILLLGAGQIGTSIILKIIENYKISEIVVVDRNPDKISIFINKLKIKTTYINVISNIGNIFTPYKFFESNLDENIEKIVEFFYSRDTLGKIRLSSIYSLIQKYKPNIIIDAMNSATSLGEKFSIETNINLDKIKLLYNDFIPKISNFVFGLLLANREIGFKKYFKISTTGLGGMGLDIPFTHGDESKLFISNALIGKVSAAGVMHQMLLSLYHTHGNKNVVLIVPSSFVGYEECDYQYVETSKGFLFHSKKVLIKDIKTNKITSLEMPHYNDEKIKMIAIKAGENHLYSKYELSLLTSANQMQAVTKEEIADLVIENLEGIKSNNLLELIDKGLSNSTYCGRIMIDELSKKINNLNEKSLGECGIATGNLGIHISKQLYELYIIINTLKRNDKYIFYPLNEKVQIKIEEYLLSKKELIDEILANDLYIITDKYVIENDFNFNEVDRKYLKSKNAVDLTTESINSWISRYNSLPEEFCIQNNDIGTILAEIIIT